ncbi:OmpH family outer membrane protein [Altericroceibacterium endophyticum]|uniref:OmpH family outer membrane protein n=1 Tax=Altericroceibacterium endophyticum TaxID=1808508 RepID=A0A6I4T0C8_9SPHN|nr:OmpH family outer membrane protein [Altericroceibacterium endophyticum]MXO64346.1 OmpH family outer membrane protein [Altericroceibacterium endophyticum]
MKQLLKPVLTAGLMLTASAAPMVMAPAAAQSVNGIGVVNVDAVVANSTAYRTAAQQRQTTYKAQIDQANARRQQIQQQIQPMVEKLQADSQAPNADRAALQQQAQQIQQLQQSAQAELQQILAPVSLSQAYGEEQINDQLATAIENAAKKQNVTMVITPDNILYADNSYNLNQGVLDELNALVPSVQVVPPEGWVPRSVRQQQQQQQQQTEQQPATPVQGR